MSSHASHEYQLTLPNADTAAPQGYFTVLAHKEVIESRDKLDDVDDGEDDDVEEEGKQGAKATPKAKLQSTFRQRAAQHAHGLRVQVHRDGGVLEAYGHSPEFPGSASRFSLEGYYSHTILTSPTMSSCTTYPPKRKLEESPAESTFARKRVQAFFAPPFSGKKSYFLSEDLQDKGNARKARASKVKESEYMPGSAKYREAATGTANVDRVLRGFITGYPPADFPMPEGLDRETIIKHYPNHLVGDVLLKIADFLSPAEIAECFGDKERMKRNTLAKRIAATRAKKDSGASNS